MLHRASLEIPGNKKKRGQTSGKFDGNPDGHSGTRE